MCCCPSIRGLAYIASTNFMSRAVVFLNSFINSLITYEVVLIYGAHLNSNVILFFQAVFMIPVFLLGCLVFIGIEKRSFNLVLYPTLTLMFLVLLRYGAEIALLIIHWEAHKSDQAPNIILFLVLDLIAITLLLIYVYFSLTSGGNDSTGSQKIHLIEAPNENYVRMQDKSLASDDNNASGGGKSKKKKKPPALPPPEEEEVKPPPRPPPSPKFNYKLRRNIGQLPDGSPERAEVEELDKQRQRNSQIHSSESPLPEESPSTSKRRPKDEAFVKTQSIKVYDKEPKRRSLLIETDLDADGSSGAKTPSPTPAAKTPSPPPPVVTPPPPAEEKAPEEEEDDGEWEWEYEEEEEPEVKKEEEVGKTEPDAEKPYKTTAV